MLWNPRACHLFLSPYPMYLNCRYILYIAANQNGNDLTPLRIPRLRAGKIILQHKRLLSSTAYRFCP